MSTETYNPIFEALKYEIEHFDNYYDYEEIVKHFLRCSAANSWHYFDFESAFDTIKIPIEEKLREHGLATFEEYLEIQYACYRDEDIEMLENMFGLQTDYVYLSGDSIFENIMKLRYETLKNEFNGYSEFEDLAEIKEEIEGLDSYLPSLKLIALFDKCIHAEHVTGQIFDIDIDSIKDEIDEEIKEGMD